METNEARNRWESNLAQSPYSFPHSKEWFTGSELKQYILWTTDPREIPLSILEIGSHEGCSACCISDIWLVDEKSSLTCVDPFDCGDPVTPVGPRTRDYFRENIRKSANASKVTLVEATSDEFFQSHPWAKFDFIYIDGAHEEGQIWRDLIHSARVLNPGGIIWCDDYDREWKHVIVNWYLQNRGEFSIIHEGYQIGFQKSREI